MHRPTSSTLFPYTTLFRSFAEITVEAASRIAAQRKDPVELGEFRQLIAEYTLKSRSNIGVIEAGASVKKDRKSTRLNSSHVSISYAVFCLKKKNQDNRHDA